MVKQITNLSRRVLFWRYANIIALTTSFVILVGLELEPLGWLLIVISTVLLLFTDTEYRKYIGLIHISVVALGLAPIGTTLDLPFSFYMGLGLLVAVGLPYFVTKYVYKSEAIHIPSFKEKGWNKRRFGYLVFTAIVAWLVIPVMLRSSSIYLNWELSPYFANLFKAYLGLNAVGIWDELFFVLTVLAIFYRFFPFLIANLLQAVFFSAFLYAVGFESWSFIVIYFFALLQGYIFKQTKSLLFILAIHLTIDLVLHLALVYLHYPHLFPYFIT